MLGVAVAAVLKVIVAVCVGAFTSRKIPDASVTIRDFGFMIANLLLPNLTFYNTAVSVNVEVFMRCSVLICLAVLFISLSAFCGHLASKVLYRARGTGIPHELCHSLYFALDHHPIEGHEMQHHRVSGRSNPHELLHIPVACIVVCGELEARGVAADEVIALIEAPTIEYEEHQFYHYGTIFACAMHNSITLPLSLLRALSVSLDWIDYAVGTSYIFIYNIVMSGALWGVGPLFVGYAKKKSDKCKKIRELVSLHLKLQMSRDVSTQTEVRGTFSPMTSPSTCKPPAAIPIPTQAESHCSVSEETRGSAEVNESIHSNMSVAVQCEGRPGQMGGDGLTVSPIVPASCETFTYNWRERGLVRVVYEREFKEELKRKHKARHPVLNCLHSAAGVAKSMLKTPAFTSSLTGLLVGLVPPLRWLFFEGPLLGLMDLIGFVSHSSIPASLLLLGANLALPPQSHAAKTGNIVPRHEAEQNTEFTEEYNDGEDSEYASDSSSRQTDLEFDRYASFTLSGIQQEYLESSHPERSREDTEGRAATVPVDTTAEESEEKKGSALGFLGIFSFSGAKKSFIFGTVILRLLLIPAVGFILVLSLRRVAPSLFSESGHDVLLLVLLGEFTAPTAINTAILFNNFQFMIQAWSKMLFFHYLACTLSMVPWLTLSLWLVS